MPGQLPPTTAYTYAAEFSVDERRRRRRHGRALHQAGHRPTWTTSSTCPSASAVPAGYYDREQEEWVGSKDGRVIKIVALADGKAQVDTDGDGTADAGLGIDDAERAKLATLYKKADTLWRVEVTHFTPWDYNFPYGPGHDAAGPGTGRAPTAPAGPTTRVTPTAASGGSIVLCDSQILGEELPITGTSERSSTARTASPAALPSAPSTSR